MPDCKFFEENVKYLDGKDTKIQIDVRSEGEFSRRDNLYVAAALSEAIQIAGVRRRFSRQGIISHTPG